MNCIEQYNKTRFLIEKSFNGLPYAHTTIIKSLLTKANPYTGIVDDISYRDIAELVTIEKAPGRVGAGIPSKQTIRNWIKSIEKECGEYFQVVSEGQALKFMFPELPKIFKQIFGNTEVDTHSNIVKTQENIEENVNINREVNTELNIEVNTHTTAVKNNNIFKITNSNKQTQTADIDFNTCRKIIGDDFYPNTETIETALSMGLTKVTELTEIQAFIKHNKKLNTKWVDFNPVFINWLKRDAQYMQKQQQKTQGILRSNHNERGTYKNILNPTALEQVSQQHGISIESLWGNTESEHSPCEFIEGTVVCSLDETDSNLRAAFY